MQNHLVTVLAVLSMTTSMVAPALAGGPDGIFRDSTDVRAGFYLRIPFAGGLKPAKDTGLSYGFSMGLDMSFAQNSFIDPRRHFQADMIKLNFSVQGFHSLAVGAQSLLGKNGVQLGAAGGDDEGKDAWGYALLGLGAIALGVVALSGGKTTCPPGTVLTASGNCVVPDPPPPQP